jgi:hypothetical protein
LYVPDFVQAGPAVHFRTGVSPRLNLRLHISEPGMLVVLWVGLLSLVQHLADFKLQQAHLIEVNGCPFLE